MRNFNLFQVFGTRSLGVPSAEIGCADCTQVVIIIIILITIFIIIAAIIILLIFDICTTHRVCEDKTNQSLFGSSLGKKRNMIGWTVVQSSKFCNEGPKGGLEKLVCQKLCLIVAFFSATLGNFLHETEMHIEVPIECLHSHQSPPQALDYMAGFLALPQTGKHGYLWHIHTYIQRCS